jgi:hypothetical protein
MLLSNIVKRIVPCRKSNLKARQRRAAHRLGLTMEALEDRALLNADASLCNITTDFGTEPCATTTTLVQHNDTRYKAPIGTAITSQILKVNDAYTDGNGNTFVQLQNSSYGNTTIPATISGPDTNGFSVITLMWTVPTDSCLSTNVRYASVGPNNFVAVDHDIIADGIDDNVPTNPPGGYEVVDANGDAVPDANGSLPGCGQQFDPAPVPITGMKFEDLDGDGTNDVGTDPGIEEWQIHVVGTDGSDNIYETDASGVYGFEGGVTGEVTMYTVTEVTQDGWTQTYGNAGYSITVDCTSTTTDCMITGGMASGNDFGNFKNVVISGRKFEDHNGDGVQDMDDQGLEGWTINIGSLTAMTDSNGDWSIAVGPGTYAIQEVNQTGWTQTYGNAGYSVMVGGSGIQSGGMASGNDFGNFELIAICGTKYYDLDADGMRDANEPGINGWNFGLDTDGDTVPDLFADTMGDTAATGGSFCFTDIGPGSYTVYELDGLTGAWGATTSTSSGPFAASSGEDVDAGDFGNVKLGAGGGHTLGFWSNKNGQATLNDGGTMAPELAMLSGLNLRAATGANFDPANYAAFRSWLLSATATNMAYMLSAQLAAMALNVESGFVSGGSLVYAPGVNGANGAGFISVSALIAEANTALGNDGYTLNGDPNRAYQEVLKNALDAGNNNLNFIVSLAAWNDADNDGVIDPGEIC